MTRRERRRLLISVGASILIAIILSVALWFNAIPSWQGLLTDQMLFGLWAPGTGLVSEVADKRAIIVAIDDRTIDQLGRFGEWPRRRYVNVIDRIREGFARGIAFDVGFPDPNQDDPLVAEALDRFLDLSDQTIDEMRAAGVTPNRRSVISPVVGTPNVSRTQRAGELTRYERVLPPQDVIVAASTNEGHANVVPDGDGVVRKTPLLIQAGDQRFPSLALAAAAAFQNRTRDGYVPDPEGPGVDALGRFIPTDQYFQMIVAYSGPPSHVNDPRPGALKVVSFLDVYEGRVDPAIFRDKMVFIGTLDATGFADDYQVPTSAHTGKMAGVEIHARAFATLVAAQFFTEQPYALTVALIWLLCVATGLLIFRINIIPGALGALALAVAYFFGSLSYVGILSATDLHFAQESVAIPNLVYPVLAVLFTFLNGATYRIVIEQAEVRATRGAMGKYLSPAVLNEVLRDPDKLHLGGDKREMTALFSDIRGFTSISEKLDPEELVSLLNEYLTVMTDIVHKHEGVLDKYMGDAIMAWWGAPTEQPDHAYQACLTAIEMRVALHELHRGWEARDVPRLENGIGVNTGPMVYGNMGSNDRFDFTVMGDAVNLASRLEGTNKEYRSNVIISEFTRNQIAATGDFVTRFLDVIEVKGKEQPVEIYELLGLTSQVKPDTPELLAAWDTAMALYRPPTSDFGLAEEAFRRVLAIRPFDGPAQMYVQRCVDLRANPPGAGWDGVFVMTHK